MDNLVTELLANIIALALETTLIVLFIKMYIKQRRIDENITYIKLQINKIEEMVKKL